MSTTNEDVQYANMILANGVAAAQAGRRADIPEGLLIDILADGLVEPDGNNKAIPLGVLTVLIAVSAIRIAQLKKIIEDAELALPEGVFDVE